MTLNKIMPSVKKFSLNEMTNFLFVKNIPYTRELVEWTTANHPHDNTEIDIWLDDGFIQIFYGINGKLLRYEDGN